MVVVDFTAAHVGQAARIALRDYEEERRAVPALPRVAALPDLRPYAENGLGVAAFEGGAMLGFLCSVPPFQNAFGSTRATGVFSPTGANGAIPACGISAADGAGEAGKVAGATRARIYGRMYQAAAEKWARAGASSHAVCLYAHDTAARGQLFRYGFGLRCVDAIRDMDMLTPDGIGGTPRADDPASEYAFEEAGRGDLPRLLALNHMLGAHMAASPTFILRPPSTPESYAEEAERRESVCLAAKYRGEIVAYIRAGRDGENFIAGAPDYLHVNGAFCLPEHRGKGLPQELLARLIHKLRARGYTRLGVDFESINPAAYGFWLKHFTAYTHSVARRIDENAIRV